MSVNASTLQKLSSMAPDILAWIDNLRVRYATDSVSIDPHKYPRLGLHFDQSTLRNTRIVSVDELPMPPVKMLGLPELIEFQQSRYDGITFIDTIFVTSPSPRESLLFHELVHAVQWKTLGPQNFLLAYGFGLMDNGYRDSFLEVMAYDFQHKFDAKTLQGNIENEIDTQCRSHWDYLTRMYSTK